MRHDEQNSTPNGGPHLELRTVGRLLLETWSKSDFSIAQTTGQHTCVNVFIMPLVALLLLFGNYACRLLLTFLRPQVYATKSRVYHIPL